MAPHSSTLAWKIPWMDEPGRLQSMGSLRVTPDWVTERLHSHFSLSCIGEGNGNPPQCSCLENPRDRGAWWAAVSGVAQSQTRLRRLSSSGNLMVLSTFSCVYWPFVCLCRNPYSSPMACFFNWVLFLCLSYDCSYIFQSLESIRYMICKHFFPIMRIIFSLSWW